MRGLLLREHLVDPSEGETEAARARLTELERVRDRWPAYQYKPSGRLQPTLAHRDLVQVFGASSRIYLPEISRTEGVIGIWPRGLR